MGQDFAARIGNSRIRVAAGRNGEVIQNIKERNTEVFTVFNEQKIANTFFRHR